MVLHLVPTAISHDTVAALEILLAAAKAGEIIGVAYVGIKPARSYVLDAAGEARQAPVFTHGLVGLLAHELIRIHRQRR